MCGQKIRSAPNPVLSIQCASGENTNKTLYSGAWKALYQIPFGSLLCLNMPPNLQPVCPVSMRKSLVHSDRKSLLVLMRNRGCRKELHSSFWSFVNSYFLNDSRFNYQPKHENISTPQKQNVNVLSAARDLWLLMNYGMCSNTFSCSPNSELKQALVNKKVL